MNLDKSQIPATITTVEALHAWTGMLLHRYFPTLKSLESPNFSDFVCQISQFQDEDGQIRMVVRINLKLTADYGSNGLKLWQSVEEFGEANIPAAYAA